jgi:hypothetical protein
MILDRTVNTPGLFGHTRPAAVLLLAPESATVAKATEPLTPARSRPRARGPIDNHISYTHSRSTRSSDPHISSVQESAFGAGSIFVQADAAAILGADAADARCGFRRATDSHQEADQQAVQHHMLRRARLPAARIDGEARIVQEMKQRVRKRSRHGAKSRPLPMAVARNGVLDRTPKR